MGKHLIIVESPTKAKTISKFLGKDYIVEASFGHVRDLPKSKLGIDVDADFTPSYTIPVKAKERVKELKEKVKNASEIILATDEDREGEAIAWHLVQALGIGTEKDLNAGKLKSNIKRIVFHEITKPAILHALENPRSIDLHLVDAQQARRVLDRLVGYELSPFLWHKIRYGLSAGRVQSVAVRLIVEREREIQSFKSQEYWSIEAKLSKKGDEKIFTAKLSSIDGKTIDKLAIGEKGAADTIVKEVTGQPFIISDIVAKTVQKNPAAPFTTSTLQQEAARKLSMSAEQTMRNAQQLYEGVHLGDEGSTGLITYMRTDSVSLAQSATQQAQEVIKGLYGSDYALSEARIYSTKSKNAQEAHEAIRPTDLSRTPKDLAPYLDRYQYKLYDLIWKRTLASQMAQAIFDHTTIHFDVKEKYGFKATGQVVKFDGYLKVYEEGTDESEEVDDTVLPELAKGEKVDVKEILPLQHFTEPPARYGDATLVKALEAHGIGRPSTYAPTLSTIQKRGYVTKEEKRYQPTDIGILVNDLLVENFPEIVDINFTSQIEESFDDIANGDKEWMPIIKDFYKPFKEHIKEKEASVEKQIVVSETPCPHCGKMMLIKFGRMGKFLACPDPESKITQPMPEEAAEIKALEEKTKDEMCPLCGKKMDVKRGRFGYFLGCSDYPKCKGISKIWNKIGFKCPNCKTGDVVERKGRGRAKPFWGCNRFPDCTFIANVKPETEAQLQELLKVWQEKEANAPKDKDGKPIVKKKFSYKKKVE
jgi:DNA topoisomerase-1